MDKVNRLDTHEGQIFDNDKLNSSAEKAEQQTHRDGLTRKSTSLCARVSRLRYPFDSTSFVPVGIPAEEFWHATALGEVFLVGTSHFAKQSRVDVYDTILAVQPDFVMLELSHDRSPLYFMDELALLEQQRKFLYRWQMFRASISKFGLANGLKKWIWIDTIDLRMSRQLGYASGGEWRAARDASRMVPGCKVVFGDQHCSDMTLHRTLDAVNFWQINKLRTLERKGNNKSLEDLEAKLEQSLEPECVLQELDALEQIAPECKRVLCDEREQYMVHTLHNLLEKGTEEKLRLSRQRGVQFKPVNIVAVVGIGHARGVHANWNQRINVVGLTRAYHRTSLISPIALLGLTAYGVYTVRRKMMDRSDKIPNLND